MLKELLQESSEATIASGRPTLVGFTRKATSLLYEDLVGIQPTNSPIATLFSIRFDEVSEDGQTWVDNQLNHRSGSGLFVFGDSKPGNPADGMEVGSYFLIDGYFFQVITAGDYAYIDTLNKAFSAALIGNLRCVADASKGGYYPDRNESVQNARFVINAWRSEVGSRKVKSPVSMEALWDMDSQGINGQLVLEDLLATTIADDINSDIIMKVITVATKHPAVVVTNVDAYYKGRTLINKACEIAGVIKSNTTFSPTYVLASAKVAYVIKASGQVDNDNMIIGTGMKLYVDNNADMEYMVVGVKRDIEDISLEGEPVVTCAAPIFYSPLEQEDEAGTFLVVRDPGSLQPNVGIIARYALSAPPRIPDLKVGATVDFGDDWVSVANKSEFAHAWEVIL